MKGELYINGVDAYETFGLTLSKDGMDTLMCPCSLKEFPENSPRGLDGTSEIIGDTARVASRQLTLPVTIEAANLVQFNARKNILCEMLYGAKITLCTWNEPGVYYHLTYRNATQFKQFNGRLGKLSLVLNESNPTNRAIAYADDNLLWSASQTSPTGFTITKPRPREI